MSWAPAGVTAVITPWNAPLMLATWRIAPALAAGNTVVAKPPELAAADREPARRHHPGGRAARRRVQRGPGPGRRGGRAAGRRTRTSPASRFTGSVATGRAVAAAAGGQLTPVSLELGGKSPLLVFADADLDLAVANAVEQYDNAGQVCLARHPAAGARSRSRPSSRRGCSTRIAALRQGDPRDEDTDIGPNISRAHVRAGRRLRAAGRRRRRAGCWRRGTAELGGLYYRPTLLAGARPGAEILTEEVFGPVLTLQTFDTEDEAVALANSTSYGLAAMLFTGDRGRRRAGRARLVAGTVWVNCFFVRDLRAPFGGARDSGIGREGGTWSFDFYSDVKNTVYAPKGWRMGEL